MSDEEDEGPPSPEAAATEDLMELVYLPTVPGKPATFKRLGDLTPEERQRGERLKCR